MFYGFTDNLYTRQFNAFISLNDSLPTSYTYRGAGTCYDYNQYVYSNGVSTLNCTARSSYMLVVGQYVSVVPYSPSTFSTVLTICEVTVVGVRQNIAADGKTY